MAPVRKGPQGKQNKQNKSPKAGPRKSAKPTKAGATGGAGGAGGKKKAKLPPPVQQKTKSAKSLDQKKNKRRVFTEQELNIPKLNMITPVGVQKPRGKKKGKVFVDDPHTMQTILALVNAETEGKIESKMLKARQMEEIREARQREAEAKEEQRKQALEDKKSQLKKQRKKLKQPPIDDDVPVQTATVKKVKRVSFG